MAADKQTKYAAAQAAIRKYVADNVPAQYSWLLNQNADEVAEYETGCAQAAVDASDAASAASETAGPA